MKVFVGTSGWSYGWNVDGDLGWYVKNSGLNSVELNSSFYRFPFPNMVKSWSVKGRKLRWSVKVNQLITHRHRFNEKALPTWEKFKELFEPMDKLIDYYLFQAPPSYADVERVLFFAEKTKLKERFALEIRNKELLGDDESCKELMKKVTLVSVDSPDYRNRVFAGKEVYLRMHGRENWYQYRYSDKELEETAGLIKENKPEEVNVYFNNDHSMLENARKMLSILRT